MRACQTLPLAAVAAAFLALPADAAVLKPSAISTTTPAGSNNPASGDKVDDVYLDTLTFAGANFSSGDSFSAALWFEVLRDRQNINSEWGDSDDNADGDDNPFVKAGYDPAQQETVVPAIQDATLLHTFNSLSLVEMSDGESGGFQFKMLFANGLTDDNPASLDGVPEIIFFERGMNDAFDVELIIGGTWESPVYSGSLNISSGDFWDTGIDVDTTEIGSGQNLGVGGFDFNEWSLLPADVVYGIRLTVTSGGPDLNGFFLAAEDPSRFQDPLQFPPLNIPLPPAAAALMLGIAALAGLRRRRRTA